ncbi:alpha-tocopherol transfer protein-like [Eupeodes corollae]|uniref:alpha-tocopherol transfer protein-like n=1 Tax=Eupeodes corollae TaxID=290404 RepID=UPI0024905A1B|nr:alpha-tocopherol transfer protein-like [Eupeodes corollae]
MNIRQISPELKLKAQNELNEVENRIPEDISRIRDWIEKQPHLNARTDDQFLLSFLRGCKFSLEKTKSKIDLYYTIKTLSPQLFLNKQIDSKAMRLVKLGPFLPLLEPLGTDGSRLHIIRYSHIDFDEFSVEEIFKIHLQVLDIQLFEDDNICIGGYTIVVDMSSLSLSTILKFDFVIINKMAIFCEKAAPLRIKGVHLVNMCKEAAYIVNAVKNFMPKSIKNRFMIHSSMESVYEHIPKKYLPTDYGGENGSLENTILHWEKVFLRYKDFFEEDVKYGVNEKLRIGEKRSNESIFGLEGSFRKLEVD